MNKLEQRFPRYSKLLSLYPSNYRQNYGEQMLQTLADMLDDPERSKTAVWSRLTLDFPLSLLKQQLIYTGEVMAMDTPYYVKRSAVVGSALVAPFFIFLALNGIMHNRLQHSWVWNSWFLFVWLILLPAIAALANIQALVRSRQAAGTAQNKRRRSNSSQLMACIDHFASESWHTGYRVLPRQRPLRNRQSVPRTSQLACYLAVHPKWYCLDKS